MTTCWHMAFAGFLGIVAVVVGDGSLAYYKVSLDAEGRFVAIGMLES